MSMWNSFVAALMLLSGACNMLILKFADITKAKGLPKRNETGVPEVNIHYYHHPVIQAMGMFGGEGLCLVIFYLVNSRFFRRCLKKFRSNDDDDYSEISSDQDEELLEYDNEEQRRLINNNANDTTNAEGNNSGTSQSCVQKISNCASRSFKFFKKYATFSIPAFLDCIATVIVYFGLTMTTPSSAQMLRGSVQIFRTLLNYIFLGDRLHKHKIVGLILLMVGLGIIVFTDFIFYTGDEMKEGHPELADIYQHILIGNLLIVGAQCLTGLQIYIEEYATFLPDQVDPVEALAWEGIWGLVILLLAAVPLSFVPGDGNIVGKFTPRGTFEDAWDAVTQMKNEPQILIATITQVISVCIFNISGINYVYSGVRDGSGHNCNGMWRMALDALRMVFIWAVSLFCNWQIFIPWQIIGFAIKLIGLCWYNGLMLPKFLYPPMSDHDYIYSDSDASDNSEDSYDVNNDNNNTNANDNNQNRNSQHNWPVNQNGQIGNNQVGNNRNANYINNSRIMLNNPAQMDPAQRDAYIQHQLQLQQQLNNKNLQNTIQKQQQQKNNKNNRVPQRQNSGQTITRPSENNNNTSNIFPNTRNSNIPQTTQKNSHNSNPNRQNTNNSRNGGISGSSSNGQPQPARSILPLVGGSRNGSGNSNRNPVRFAIDTNNKDDDEAPILSGRGNRAV